MESSPAKKPRMDITYIPTPKWLKQQESIVNVKNEDNQCFKWSVLAALNPVTGDAADDVASYTSFENNLNFDELNFPILIKDIPKFEENNKNFSVNIYSCEKKHVLPTIKSMAVNKKEINLLRITSRGRQHYCWIKDLQIFLNANSESSHLPTPKWLQKTKSIVNVKNYDNQCFKWSVLAALHPVNGDAAEDVLSYTRFENDLKFDELNFPISIEDIPKFEESNNNNNICVNVYVVQNKTLVTAYTSKVVNKKEINLLHISSKGKQHYCWIKDLGSVLFANPGSSYIPTPDWLKQKESIVNVKNNDRECFKWSVLAALHPAPSDTADNVSSYEIFKNDPIFDNLNFPISLTDIPTFEERSSLCVDVYTYERKQVILKQESKTVSTEKINLILISEKSKQHYCWIKNLELLLYGDSYIATPGWLQKKECIVNVDNDDTQCFKWSVLALLHPVTGDAAEKVSSYERFQDDLSFSAMSFPILIADIPEFERQNNLSIHVYSYDSQIRIFSAYTSQLINQREINLLLISEKKKHHYCGIKDLTLFLSTKDGKPLCKHCLNPVPDQFAEDHLRLCPKRGVQAVQMPGEKGQIWKFNPLYDKNIPIVIYADFVSNLEPCQLETDNGQKLPKNHKPCGFAYKIVGSTPKLSRNIEVYRGENAADKFLLDLLDKEKWMQSKFPDYSRKDWIPVFIHNLNRYESHLLIQSFMRIKESKEDVKFGCMANTEQDFFSFKIGSLQFIDSSFFLRSPIATLVSNLKKYSNYDFKNTTELTKCKDELKLLLKKLVYPYEYLDSHDKFNQQSLPPLDMFYCSQNYRHVTEEDYEHANKVWETFKIKNLGEYHDLFIKTQVLLLADVFENFRYAMKKYYELDPAHFHSTTQLGWESALKMTKFKLQFLTDIDMYLMIENGIRGGVAMVSRRYSKANNPKVPDFDPSKPKTWIICLEANQIHGRAMSQHLPEGGFKWLTNEEIEDLDIQSIKDDADTGYILEVDLEYPEELHNKHKDFPLAPEKIEVTSEMLSPYCKKLFEEFGMKEPTEDRLIPNLRNKEKYVLHYSTLKLYLNLGMKLIKTHRVISFNQSSWLHQYIDFNTQRRKKSPNEDKKDYFKLMSRSTFQIYDTKFQMAFTDEELIKAKMMPNCQVCIDVNGMKIVLYKKKILLLKHPIYVGFTVLDLAKFFIYDFHYNHIRFKYGDKAKLLFTDTDSLCYEIETEDIYDDMKNDQCKYDFSNYPTVNPLFDKTNENVVGKMKDKTCGEPINEFVGLTPKMYSLRYGNTEKYTAVDVPRDYLSSHISFDDYLNCLRHEEEKQGEVITIKSVDHQLSTDKTSRIILSPV